MKTIANYRDEIDQLHKELHSLLFRRRDLAMEIWKLKQVQGLPFFNPEREAQILQDFVAQGTAHERDPQMDLLLTGVMQSLLREYETYLRAQFPSES